MMKRSYLLSVLLLLCTPVAAAAQQLVLGIGRAKDGDTLLVGEREVRLFGVDAPEFDQTCSRDGKQWSCGAAAADALMNFATGKDVECVSAGVDQYGRTLGRCSAAGVDINRTLVSLGLATAYRRYSSDYVAAEAEAKARRVGIWAGSFEAPEHYRHTGGLPAEVKSKGSGQRTSTRTQSAAAQGSCNIKGNRNRKGQWIYHLPWMPYYDETRAEEVFCSEAQAQAAGYRRAIVR
jgi:endonuclease YncB( thermonuclease family)